MATPVRVLLDACVPVDLRHAIIGFNVTTSRFAGLSRLSNGALLSAAAGRFDVLVTVDASILRQQNFTDRPIAIIVLRAVSNRVQDLLPLMSELLIVLGEIVPGEVTVIGRG
jgi:hypothetical protein